MRALVANNRHRDALTVLGTVPTPLAVPPRLPATVAPLTVPAGCCGSRTV